jgi:shikimate dehydrogenase
MTYPWREAPSAQFAVIGDPIQHSLSPKMHHAAYIALGLDYRYVAIQVSSGEVSNALDHLRNLEYKGVNITVPHKEAAFAWAKSHDEVAAKLGVCNTLGLGDGMGVNTDVPGFSRSCQGIAFAEGKALVLGAGGSARAVIESLLWSGWDVCVWNRTHERALQIDAPIDVQKEIDLSGVSLVVNTTSASLTAEPLPIEEMWTKADRDIFLIDISYGAEPTRLMQSATQAGLRTMDGRRMLMEQGALAFEFWLGQSAPRESMMAALFS